MRYANKREQLSGRKGESPGTPNNIASEAAVRSSIAEPVVAGQNKRSEEAVGRRDPQAGDSSATEVKVRRAGSDGELRTAANIATRTRTGQLRHAPRGQEVININTGLQAPSVPPTV